MPNNSERIGTQFTIDISNLKAGLAQANRMIRESEAEFKSAAAGMDDWTQSQDGLSAKIKQLNKTLDLQNAKVDALERQKREIIATMKKEGKSNEEIEIAVDKVNTQLNREYNALNKTKGELEKHTKALEDLNEEQGRTKLQQLTDGFKSAGKESGNAAGSFTVAKGALADLASDGIKKVAEELKDMVLELDTAETKFQSMTGIADEAVGEFSESISDIYNSGIGDTMGEVAESMAIVKQTFNDLDVSALEKINKNALILNETFGMDVQESVRSVDMLMKKFGITADEAFNLIVQGAQKGLNKNGDLLDTVDEFSTSYARMGYTAEDMFNSMANGADNGVYQINKVGDAVNEFSIRVKDTSNTTTEAFETIGLNADGMREAFAKGGDSAKEATEKTIKALSEMSDEVKRNEAGVALFGSFWEDMGEEAIFALMNTNGELSKTEDAMNNLNDVQFSSIDREIASLGREIKGSLSDEMGKKALPAVRDFLKEIKKSGVIEKFSDAIAWTVEHFKELTAGIGTAVAAYNTLKIAMNISKAVKTATTSIEGFGAALTANPIGLWVSAIGAAVTAVTALKSYINSLPSQYDLLSESITANTEAAQAWQEALDSATVEIGDYSQYIDSAGRSSDGLKTKVQEAQNKITEIYQNAFSKNRELRSSEIEAIKKYNLEYIEAQAELAQYEADVALAKVDWLKYRLENEQLSYEETQGILNQMSVLEQEYLDKTGEIYANSAVMYQQMVNNGAMSQEEMKAQREKDLNEYDNYINSYKQVNDEVAQSALDHQLAMQNIDMSYYNDRVHYFKSEEEIRNYYAAKEQEYRENEKLSWMERNTLILQTQQERNMLLQGFKNGDEVYWQEQTFLTEQGVQQEAQSYFNWLGNVKEYGGSISEASKQNALDILAAYEDLPEDLQDEGLASLQQLAAGMDEAYPELENAADMDMETLLKTMKNAIGDIPIETGKNVLDGLQSGLQDRKKTSALWNIATDIGRKVIAMINKGAVVKSPSRATKNTGMQIDNGLIVGMEENFPKVLKTAKNSMSQLRKVYEDTGDITVSTKIAGAKTQSGATSSMSGGSGSVNVYQTNNYAQAHSRYEIYQTKKQTEAAVRLALAR